LGHPVKTVH